MINYQITYESNNRYEDEVVEAFFEFLVSPLENKNQQITHEDISHSSEGDFFYSENVFGYNKLCLRVAKPFTTFNLKYECQLKKEDKIYIPTKFDMLSWEDEQQILQSEAYLVDSYPFVNQSHLTDISLHEIPQEMHFQKNTILLDYVILLNKMIYEYLKYIPKQSTTFTTARETLIRQAGVCQDYTHLMLGILRSQKIACRYVSGYLHQGQNTLGEAQMHAWVEVCFPKYGWCGFDPTNNLFTDQHYIKIADGQDYEDCKPINGFIKPGTTNYTEYTVKVIDQ